MIGAEIRCLFFLPKRRGSNFIARKIPLTAFLGWAAQTRRVIPKSSTVRSLGLREALSAVTKRSFQDIYKRTTNTLSGHLYRSAPKPEAIKQRTPLLGVTPLRTHLIPVFGVLFGKG